MIYFIQDTGSKAIKIGISYNPPKRLAALQTAHASRLTLMGVMDGGQREERALHHRFARLQGEWFEPTEGLLAFVQANAKPFTHAAKSTTHRRRYMPQHVTPRRTVQVAPPVITKEPAPVVPQRPRATKAYDPLWQPRPLSELLPPSPYDPPAPHQEYPGWVWVAGIAFAIVLIIATMHPNNALVDIFMRAR
jgi:hypothetical protein